MRELTERIIGAAIEVHRTLGPGLFESSYEECLAHEMTRRGIGYERQRQLPLFYKEVRLDCAYRVDFLVERRVVVELKVVDELRPLHRAQLLSYLKLGGWTVGLLINFNVPVLTKGVKRLVLSYSDPSATSASLRVNPELYDTSAASASQQ